MGSLPTGHHFCCVVNYFFKFLEVIVIKEISADKIAEVLTAVILCYLLSRTFVSDNGPCFMLGAFKMILSGLDIKHHLINDCTLAAGRWDHRTAKHKSS
jgi:hypothetical protein